MVRSFVALLAFSLLFWVIAFGLVVTPAYAFLLSDSSTGYVRKASQAAVSSMLTAQRSAQLASLGSSIVSSSAGSVGVRLVASSVGWPALGIVAGMALAMAYYDSTKVAAIKAAAAPPGAITVPGYNGNPITSYQSCPGGADCSGGIDQVIFTQGGGNCSGAYPWGTLPAGWSNQGAVAACTPPAAYTWKAVHNSANTATKGTIGASTPATSAQIQTYIGGLPSNDPLSLESNTIQVGSQVSPLPSDTTASNPVDATSLATEVVPASTVTGTDLVVNPNAVPPDGTTQTKTGTQPTTGTSTKTTTTTTNPDGSVTTTSTDTQTDTASVSCTSGNHDDRTFGSILSTHVNQWKNVGILGTLNNLKNIVWPSALPTYTFGPTLLGTFTLNFNTWAWVFSDVRAITIAIAAIYGVAIVFRGRASA
ncbi:MAG: hypothetical protein Q8L74_10090 [Nitrospirota bacterium]|nr:hypothetical protein [Nitrospirota bacterium]